MSDDFDEEREEFIRASQSAGSVEDRYIMPRPHPAARSYKKSRLRAGSRRKEVIVAVVFVIVVLGVPTLLAFLADR